MDHPETATDSLWNDAFSVGRTRGEVDQLVLEQYRIAVEMADRVSARRATTNSFFMGINSLAATGASLLWYGLLRGPADSRPDRVALAAPVVASLVGLWIVCFLWERILISYRNLNSAKYRVIGRMEERLPCSPYWRAEWAELGEGKDKARYWPLTHIERLVPVAFGVVHLAMAVGIVAAV